MILSNEIKYFNRKQNLIFILSSLLLIWMWMLIASYIDRGNDRGLVTIIGIATLTSLIFSLFLSKNKIAEFFTSLIFLLISSFLIFILSFTLGLFLESLTKLNWIGFIVPIVTSGILTYLNIRRLISFPNNKKAFWYIFIIPVVIVIGICSLPFYDGIFTHDFGIGFLISIYLTSVFVLIGILCRIKTTGNTVYN
ncbi:hypothetical protein LX95_02881 [Mesonia algae]|uniref:Uncharacterized protein n=1 Tax=Mesonia algae TaxID=213248 RepID=A0A2W7II04_9FLAO|nr:hypothetical protein LX95_02881 [Mesonia algae]